MPARPACAEVNPMHAIIRYTLVIAAAIAVAAMITSLGFNNWRNLLVGGAAVIAARMAFRYLFGGRHSE